MSKEKGLFMLHTQHFIFWGLILIFIVLLFQKDDAEKRAIERGEADNLVKCSYELLVLMVRVCNFKVLNLWVCILVLSCILVVWSAIGYATYMVHNLFCNLTSLCYSSTAQTN